MVCLLHPTHRGQGRCSVDASQSSSPGDIGATGTSPQVVSIRKASLPPSKLPRRGSSAGAYDPATTDPQIRAALLKAVKKLHHLSWIQHLALVCIFSFKTSAMLGPRFLSSQLWLLRMFLASTFPSSAPGHYFFVLSSPEVVNYSFPSFILLPGWYLQTVIMSLQRHLFSTSYKCCFFGLRAFSSKAWVSLVAFPCTALKFSTLEEPQWSVMLSAVQPGLFREEQFPVLSNNHKSTLH